MSRLLVGIRLIYKRRFERQIFKAMAADGDTFTLLTNEKIQVKIRLHGIDCPENGQPFSKAAKDFLSALIFYKVVEVEKKDIDRYGRTIGIVSINGKNVNEAFLIAGLAWHYTYYDKNVTWSAFQNEAMKQKAGLWSEPNPVAPWEWRRIKKASSI
ncbi:MAG: thermonuclease family protein [Chitinophagaceae bacterium]